METITVSQPTIEPKGWGEELIVINCPDYCGKILKFKKFSSGSLHFHRDKHETWYILKGCISLTTLDTTNAISSLRLVKSGEIVDIPRLCPHKVIALEDTDIMEVSTTHSNDDTYRLAQGDSQRKI